MLDLLALCLVITAALAYLNARFVGLPIAIGVMGSALLLTLSAIGLDATGLGHGLRAFEESLVRSIDFSDVLMQGMLSLLLFAGALHVDLSQLTTYRWQVGGLAVVSTVLSTLLVGLAAWWLLPWVGVHLSPAYCLVFGALISPTDPIAVMGILKSSGAPKNLEMVIAGESLFNDGVGVVLFSLVAGLLTAGHLPSVGEGMALLLREAGGGLVFGAVLGVLTLHLLRSVDSHQVEVLLTLAAVLGGYALASRLHVSGPLAMVVVGLMIGNGRDDGVLSQQTRRYMDPFWELVDEILNAVLFVLIGMQALVVPFSWHLLAGGAIAVAITLAARAATVGWPVSAWPRAFRLPVGAGWVLTWGGLRGGISVALALSLPAGTQTNTVLALTYCIVVFSIIVQGLSIGRVVRWAVAASDRR